MLLLAASHIKFIYSIQLQLQHSSFHSAEIIQKHIGTYYSSIFEYILFIFIIHSNVYVYYSNMSCAYTFRNLFLIYYQSLKHSYHKSYICCASARPSAFLSTTKSLCPYIPSSCGRNVANRAVRL